MTDPVRIPSTLHNLRHGNFDHAAEPVAEVAGGAEVIIETVSAAMEILDVESSNELARIFGAVGLAENIASMRAFADEGIQTGHIKLHAKNIAREARRYYRSVWPRDRSGKSYPVSARVQTGSFRAGPDRFLIENVARFDDDRDVPIRLGEHLRGFRFVIGRHPNHDGILKGTADHRICVSDASRLDPVLFASIVFPFEFAADLLNVLGVFIDRFRVCTYRVRIRIDPLMTVIVRTNTRYGIRLRAFVPGVRLGRQIVRILVVRFPSDIRVDCLTNTSPSNQRQCEATSNEDVPAVHVTES